MTATILYDATRNALFVSGIAFPFPAGSLQALQSGSQLAVANPIDGTLICAWADYGAWSIEGASVFASVDAAFAALSSVCTRQPVTGSPQRTYAQPVVGQGNIFPLVATPTDVNTVALLVNGVAYYPPDTMVSSLAVTWQGPFPLDQNDAVRVAYF